MTTLFPIRIDLSLLKRFYTLAKLIGILVALSLLSMWMTKNPNLFSTLLPPSQYHLSKFSKRKVHKILPQLNTSKSKGPDGISAIVHKSCALNSSLFPTNFFSFLTLLGYFLLLGNLPKFFISPKRGHIWPFELSPICNHFTHL